MTKSERLPYGLKQRLIRGVRLPDFLEPTGLLLEPELRRRFVALKES